jgi:hypothetical protein
LVRLPRQTTYLVIRLPRQTTYLVIRLPRQTKTQAGLGFFYVSEIREVVNTRLAPRIPSARTLDKIENRLFVLPTQTYTLGF